MLRPIEVIYDIRIADGEKGKRLAPVQARAIIDVLNWAVEQQRVGKRSSVAGDEQAQQSNNVGINPA